MKNSLNPNTNKSLSIVLLTFGFVAGLYIAIAGVNFFVSLAADKGIDADALPATSGTLGIGTGGSTWSSINDLIYFSGSLVGIGATPTARELEITGGLRLNTSKLKPSCASGVRGLWWYSANASGTKDALEVCVKNASDTYLWRTVY